MQYLTKGFWVIFERVDGDTFEEHFNSLEAFFGGLRCLDLSKYLRLSLKKE